MERLRLFPLNTVLFPGAALNLHIFEPRYKQMITECVQADEPFGVCLIREGDEAGDPEVMPHDVGTTAEIADVTALEGGRFYISTTGRRRFRIDRVVSRDPFLLCDVEYIGDDELGSGEKVDALVGEIREVFREYLRLLVEYSGVHADVDMPADPVEASFLIGDALEVAATMKQRLLELTSVEQRLTVELGFLRRHLPQLRSYLEKKREHPSAERNDAPGGSFRAKQEKYFGKHFSLN
jgi:Lon protease-like protein